ncbi:MAG: hypothetical protein JWM25_638 [Thermoleophilia bacterium]|nr:hypothetical protein [Thermoleophilia bacterium]
MSSPKLRSSIATCAAALMLIVPMSAFAASPTIDQYGNPAAEDLGPVAGNVATPDATGTVAAGDQAAVDTTAVKAQSLAAAGAAPETVGILPFTGSELRVLILACIALLAAGAVLRRVSFGTRAVRRRSTH